MLLKKITKFSKLFSSNREAKVLAENFIWLSVLQLAGYLFPLITIPYLARTIGVDKFGEIAFATAIMVYFQTLVDWGFSFTATRDIAKNQNNINKVSLIYSNVMWAKFLLMIISFIILIILIFTIPKLKENQLLLFISFSIIPGQMMFPDWLFQGLEKMKFMTILNLLLKLIFTVSIFFFIKEKSDYILQPLLVSISYFLVGIIALYIIQFKWNIKIKRTSFNEILMTMRSSKDVFINQLTPNLYNNFSTLLLGFLNGPVANGKLDAGNKFIIVGQQMMSIVSRTFYPFLSRRIDKHRFYAISSLTLSLAISIIIFLFAPFVIRFFFTEEFTDAILVLRILSFSIFFLTICSVYGTNYLILKNYEKNLKNITLIVSIIGFLIAIPLIYFFTFIGAAVTILITRAILGISIMVYALKIKKSLKLIEL